MRKPKKSARQAVQELGEAMDLPAQLLPGFCHVELWQNRQAVIEGVKGVLACTESEIQLNLGALVVSIRGAQLCIRSYQMEQLALHGTIAEVSFSN